MRIIEDIEEIRKVAKEARHSGKKVALVPTMGFLHQGHLSLVREAKKHADLVVVSIFLNPTQFNMRSDFDKYPRDLEKDLELLRAEKVAVAFCPTENEVYHPGSDTWVSVDALSSIHEGEFRPGHFRGVTTVVNILFNLIYPDFAVFGEKDFQQLGLIRKMVKDLHMPVKIIAHETVRENDGLAMSSRNARLSASARQAAPGIYHALRSGAELFLSGVSSSAILENAISEQILSVDSEQCAPIKIEYVRVIDPVSFERRDVAAAGDRIVLAAWIDGVRLIDNIALQK